MKLLLLACLVAVCAAAPPPHPKIPETFTASGEIEFHLAEKTMFGKFDIGRDQTKQMGLELSHFDDTKEIEEALLRYDMKPDPMAYYIRGTMGGEHCSPDKRNGTAGGLPAFWAWVSMATYEGEQIFRHVPYDFWGYSIGDVRFELAVSKTAPNVPAFYNRKEPEDFVKYSFMSFNATAPDASAFQIPKPCEDL